MTLSTHLQGQLPPRRGDETQSPEAAAGDAEPAPGREATSADALCARFVSKATTTPVGALIAECKWIRAVLCWEVPPANAPGTGPATPDLSVVCKIAQLSTCHLKALEYSVRRMKLGARVLQATRAWGWAQPSPKLRPEPGASQRLDGGLCQAHRRLFVPSMLSPCEHVLSTVSC